MADTIVLVRGLPGSGKTSFSINCLQNDAYVSADAYFEDEDGNYKFVATKLPEAHAWCAKRVREHISNKEVRTIYVANTFSMRWEMQPYFNIVESYPPDIREIRIYVVDLFDGGLSDEQLAERNIHNVPLKTIQVMRQRWEHDWGDANPRKPAKYWADARERGKDESRNR